MAQSFIPPCFNHDSFSPAHQTPTDVGKVPRSTLQQARAHLGLQTMTCMDLLLKCHFALASTSDCCSYISPAEGAKST